MAVYYIDNVAGKAENDGKSPEFPLNTNIGLKVSPGDSVLFKRGSLIRGALNNVEGEEGNPITYGAYGEGENPIFCGSEDVSSESDWTETEKNIWKCSKNFSTEVCNVIFPDSCGTLCWEYENLTRQGDFYDICFGYSNANREMTEHGFYIYSEKNPAVYYGHIEAVVRTNRELAKNGHDMNYYNLTFINNGVHAIAGEIASRNLHIKNCKFFHIGGSVWDKDRKIRFGNGAEFWDIAENVTVEDCEFDNIYDSAVTHQGGSASSAKNLVIKNNIFKRCGMAAYEQRDMLPESGEFSGNICTAAGEGFSHAGIELPRYSEIYPQPMGHHIFMWRIDSYKGKSDFKITGNTFGDAPYGAVIYSICGREPEEKIEIDNNLYKCRKYTLINNYYGRAFDDFEEYRQVTGKDKHSKWEE